MNTIKTYYRVGMFLLPLWIGFLPCWLYFLCVVWLWYHAYRDCQRGDAPRAHPTPHHLIKP